MKNYAHAGLNIEGEKKKMFEDIQTHCQTHTHIRGINHIYFLKNSLNVVDNSFVQQKERGFILLRLDDYL